MNQSFACLSYWRLRATFVTVSISCGCTYSVTENEEEDKNHGPGFWIIHTLHLPKDINQS